MDQAQALAEYLRQTGGNMPGSGLSQMMMGRGQGPVMETNNAAPPAMPQRPNDPLAPAYQGAAEGIVGMSPPAIGYGAGRAAGGMAQDPNGENAAALAIALIPGLRGRLPAFLRGKGEAGPAKPIDPSADPVGWYMQEKNAGRPPSDQPSPGMVRRDQILASHQAEMDAVAQLKAAERAKLQAEADNATAARMQALQSQTGAVRAAMPPAMPPAPPSPPPAPPVPPQAGIRQGSPPPSPPVPLPPTPASREPRVVYSPADRAITQPAVLEAVRNDQPMPSGGDLAALLRSSGRPDPNMTKLNERANNAATMRDNMRSAGTPADQAANIMESNMKAFPQLLPVGAGIAAGVAAEPEVHPKFKDRDVEGRFISKN